MQLSRYLTTVCIFFYILLLFSAGCSERPNKESLKQKKELVLQLIQDYNDKHYEKCIEITDRILAYGEVADLRVKLIRGESFFRTGKNMEAKEALSYIQEHKNATRLKMEDFLRSPSTDGSALSWDLTNYGFDTERSLTHLGQAYSYYLMYLIALEEQDTSKACTHLTGAINVMGNFIGSKFLPNDYPFELQMFGVNYLELQKARYKICRKNPYYHNRELDSTHIAHFSKRNVGAEVVEKIKALPNYSDLYSDPSKVYRPLPDRRTYLQHNEMALFHWGYAASQHDIHLAQLYQVFHDLHGRQVIGREQDALALGYETWKRDAKPNFTSDQKYRGLD